MAIAKKKPAARPAQTKRRKSARDRNVTPPLEHKQKNLLIVGIGASADGLRAFEQFFSQMPPDSGVAFILILHLDPSHVSMLPELLRKYTEMAVLQAKDGTEIETNTIYIPPNKKMAIKHGALVVTEPTEPRGLRLPIDTFSAHWPKTKEATRLALSFREPAQKGHWDRKQSRKRVGWS